MFFIITLHINKHT